MRPATQHQCLIYDGAPSRQLPAIATVIREKLEKNHRCLYLNSRPMVAGMRSYLAASGVDVTLEVAKHSLVLSSDQSHLTGGKFDVAGMMATLEDAFGMALHDGYAGLWASGDMSFEMGHEKDLKKLLAYEWRLEEFLRTHPAMGGICQYHAATLPREMLRHGLLVHPSLFVNETLSMMNPHYLQPEFVTPEAAHRAELKAALARLCATGTGS
ncbi:MAG: MEDS domain-containing protein [Acidobacteriaceae bacterium]